LRIAGLVLRLVKTSYVFFMNSALMIKGQSTKRNLIRDAGAYAGPQGYGGDSRNWGEPSYAVIVEGEYNRQILSTIPGVGNSKQRIKSSSRYQELCLENGRPVKFLLNRAQSIEAHAYSEEANGLDVLSSTESH
jgi:hypothetical protein